MHWLYLRAHWAELHPAMRRSFPALKADFATDCLADMPSFVASLAAENHVTEAEAIEMIDDIILNALCAGTLPHMDQTNDVTQRMVASS